MRRRLTIKEGAFLGHEWGRGVPQKTLAERYHLSTAMVSAAIREALHAYFPGIVFRNIFARKKYAADIPVPGVEPKR